MNPMIYHPVVKEGESPILTIEQFLKLIDDYYQAVNAPAPPKAEDKLIGNGGGSTALSAQPDQPKDTVSEEVQKDNETTSTGDVSTGEIATELPQKANKPDNLMWFIIGGAVVLIGGVLTVVLIRKKKKTR